MAEGPLIPESGWFYFKSPFAHNLFSTALWLLQLAIMFDNSSAPLSVRGQSQMDQIFRQLCSLLYRILDCPPSELFSGSVGYHRVVAMVAMVFSFIGIFANLTTPAMWSWSRGGGLDKKNGKEDCMSGI
ncbi:hypothetical protein SUGI_0890180 [Cryptomeria japonica]|nr:hypothetical protein SUGI_0890180 [Cryptomeria japonica]